MILETFNPFVLTRPRTEVSIYRRFSKKMRNYILYSYLEGLDHAAIAESVTSRLSDFIKERKWVSGNAWVVDQKLNYQWELGMNLELPDPHAEPNDWFSDVEEIAVICNEIARSESRTFMIGVSDQTTKVANDLFQIDGGVIDIERLQSVIGVKP